RCRQERRHEDAQAQPDNSHPTTLVPPARVASNKSSLEREAHAGAAQAVISGSLHENISRIGEDAKIRSEPEFQPSACMAKGCFDRVPFVSATAEHVRRQRKRVQRPAK